MLARARMLAVMQDGENGLNQTNRAEISATRSTMLVRKNGPQMCFIRSVKILIMIGEEV